MELNLLKKEDFLMIYWGDLLYFLVLFLVLYLVGFDLQKAFYLSMAFFLLRLLFNWLKNQIGEKKAIIVDVLWFLAAAGVIWFVMNM
jgi:uncharacterized MAPEG superfamily protein